MTIADNRTNWEIHLKKRVHNITQIFKKDRKHRTEAKYMER